MKIINLHTNTTFSFLESTVELDKLFSWAKENNVDTLAITEHNNMLSYASFCIKASQNNIKTIYGIDLDTKIGEIEFRVILLAKNEDGLKKLFELSFEIYKQKIDFNKILECENIIIIDHPVEGFFHKTNKKILTDNSNFYIGLSERFFELNKPQDFNSSKFLLVNENRIFDMLENKTLQTLEWIKTQNQKNIFTTALTSEIETDDPNLIDIINQTNKLASELVISIHRDKFKMPKYPNDLGVSSVEYLKKIVLDNIETKLANKKAKKEEYIKRMRYELSIIQDLNYEDYFLIIWDFIHWAKNNNISIGPGRGSAAGSLIAYLMDITQIDPLDYDLLFERFLNPKRVTMPDIDIDVQDDKRSDVIEYLISKYGPENVSTIVTFSTLGAKSAMRDAARSLLIPNPIIDSLAKKIPVSAESLKQVYEETYAFEQEIDRYKNKDTGKNDLKEAFEEACQIEGFYRQSGTHAAGVVISQNKIINQVPVMINSMDNLQTQVSMEHLEEFGLLKVDILGLRTLTIINEIIEEVKKNSNPDFDIEKIDLNDKKTFDLLSKAKTAGIFQLESPGMRNTLLKVKVSNFNDIASVIALFRPGTIDMISTFAKRKNGQEEIEKINDVYDEITKTTYGIVVYQEQILQLVQRISNMDYAEADLLRRAISKKKIEEFEKFKDIFVTKAVQNGYTEEFAYDFFEKIEKFAGYGFNKSHTISYALITYRMAYLKAHYPLEFYSAIISSSVASIENLNKYALEAQELGIKVISPTINLSESKSRIIGNEIILPFSMIKGLGITMENKILELRKKEGKFTNLLKTILLLREAGLGEEKIKLLAKASVLREFDTQTNIVKNLENDTEFKMEFLNAYSIKTKEVNWNIVNLDIKPQQYEQDFETEAINEIELLGRSYNISRSSKYESSVKLIDIHPGTQHRIALFIKEAVVKISKFNKEYTQVTLVDSSATVNAFIWKRSDEFVALKNKLAWVTITKTQKGDWRIQDCEEIK